MSAIAAAGAAIAAITSLYIAIQQEKATYESQLYSKQVELTASLAARYQYTFITEMGYIKFVSAYMQDVSVPADKIEYYHNILRDKANALQKEVNETLGAMFSLQQVTGEGSRAYLRDIINEHFAILGIVNNMTISLGNDQRFDNNTISVEYEDAKSRSDLIDTMVSWMLSCTSHQLAEGHPIRDRQLRVCLRSVR